MIKRISLSLTAFLLLSFPLSAYAGDIKYIRLESTQTPTIGEVDVGSISYDVMPGQAYSVSNFDFKNKSDYKLGDSVKATFTLIANEDSKFIDIKPAACIVDNETAATDIEIKDNGKTLVLNFDLPAIHVKLEAPGNLKLSEDGLATWDKVANADNYTVKIQKMNTTGGRDTVKLVKTNKSYFDMSDYMYSDEGDYLYSVMALSDTYYLDDSDYSGLSVGESILVKEEDIGEDISILNDEDGKARLSGEYVSNKEIKIAGQWFYFGEDSIWISGWREDLEGWKYYDPETHRRVKGITKIDGKEYYFDKETGLMQTGLVNTPEGEVFYSATGERALGWLSYDGDTYYINKDGTRNTKMLIDPNNKTYIFYKDGRLVR